jgi:excisionase family DNA binding protein
MTDDIQMSISECAEYGNVGRQAIFLAIKKQKLKAAQINGRWRINKSDYEEYRLDRYNRQKHKVDGERVFDVESGLLTADQVRTVLSHETKTVFTINHIYYLLRTGDLPSYRKGKAWVISMPDVQAFIEKYRKRWPQLGRNSNQA